MKIPSLLATIVALSYIKFEGPDGPAGQSS